MVFEGCLVQSTSGLGPSSSEELLSAVNHVVSSVTVPGPVWWGAAAGSGRAVVLRGGCASLAGAPPDMEARVTTLVLVLVASEETLRADCAPLVATCFAERWQRTRICTLVCLLWLLTWDGVQIPGLDSRGAIA